MPCDAADRGPPSRASTAPRVVAEDRDGAGHEAADAGTAIRTAPPHRRVVQLASIRRSRQWPPISGRLPSRIRSTAVA